MSGAAPFFFLRGHFFRLLFKKALPVVHWNHHNTISPKEGYQVRYSPC